MVLYSEKSIPLPSLDKRSISKLSERYPRVEESWRGIGVLHVYYILSVSHWRCYTVVIFYEGIRSRYGTLLLRL